LNFPIKEVFLRICCTHPIGLTAPTQSAVTILTAIAVMKIRNRAGPKNIAKVNQIGARNKEYQKKFHGRA
jgi:hypothetical protein